MTLCGPGEVGVTGREVGHVGGVIPGKGSHAPQGRAHTGSALLRTASPSPRACSGQHSRVAHVCVRARAQLRGAELGKDCFSRHVENGLERGQRR